MPSATTATTATTATRTPPPQGAAQQRDLPPQYRAASLVPASYNAADNTIECVWTTGARVRRYDYWNDTPYDEELVVTPEAVNMARFEAGAVQVLDNHSVYGGVNAILGIAQRGWIMPDGQGRALLRLSARPELAGVVADIISGVIRSISVGYSVERYVITPAQGRADGGAIPLYSAVAWTPAELSFVTVPADADAGTRAQPQSGGQGGGLGGGVGGSVAATQHRSQGGTPCEFFTREVFTRATAQQLEHTMGLATDTPAQGAGNTAAADDAAAAAAAAALTTATRAAATATTAAAPDVAAQARQLAADVTDLCQRLKAPAELTATLVRTGATLDQARLAVLEKRALDDEARGGASFNLRVDTVSDETKTRLAGIEEAFLHRVDGRAKLTDNGRQFRGMSLLEIGRDHLESRGINCRGMDRMELATRMLTHRSGGMLSTSDFSSVLANVANKRLRQAYDQNVGTYNMWARRAPNAPDFKTITVVQLGDMPDLLQTNEHGEFKYGSFKDGQEVYSLLTYGRIVSLTRQAVINDDLRAFDRIISAFGGSAARLENRTVYAQLTANAAMGDGTALFHANHGNLATGGGSALQFSSLTTMRTAMRTQKGLQTNELNIVPAYLICPAALEQTAYQLTSSNYVPAKQSDVNEFRQGGRTALEPIIEPVLDASSATAWYATANNNQVDTVEFCWLDGAEGPVIESEMGFEVDGVSFKCREDFAAKAIDWRGMYRAVGA